MKSYNEIYEKLIFADDYKPDPWQRQVLEHKGNISIRAGRQTGKSVTVGKKTAKIACEYDNINILIIAASQRQSSMLFEKTYAELLRVHDELLKLAGGFKDDPKKSRRQNMEERKIFEREYGIFAETPTKTEIKLKNNTRIYSLPAGKTGMFIRGLTIDVMIEDEDAYIPEAVHVAVGPMLAVSKKERGMGWEIALSTPFGKGGHFFETQHDLDYLQIHVTSEQCPRISREFLAKKKANMSKLEYTQEYLAEFVDEFNQFFPTDLVKNRMTFMFWDLKKDYNSSNKYFLGVDIARYGADENAFVVCEVDNKDHVKVVYIRTTENKSLTDTTGRIIDLNEKFRFNRIFIDDNGVGGGVLDILIDTLGKTKVLGLNNASKTEDKFGRKGKILKEDLYSHARMLMEKEPMQIELINDLKLLKSLKSMTFEYTSDRNLRIFGAYSHISEAFVRSLWGLKSKGLNLFLY